MSAASGINSYMSEDPEEILKAVKNSSFCDEILCDNGEAAFPFHEGMLKLLRRSNPLEQTYYFIEDGKHYAFFCTYINRMNLFAFGKAQWFMKIRTVAFPCSLSCGGYITNDLKWMLGYIKTIKGCKLVLNIDKPVEMKGMAFGETLPTCRLHLKKEHTSAEAFIDSLRSPYRRRIKLALKNCTGIKKHICSDDSYDVHPLYLQTYDKSEYKLECLEKEFFDKSEGEKIVFLKEDKPLGFVLLKENAGELVFMLCGMDYKEGENNADLYWYMLLNIVSYAIDHGCSSIDFGQTSEKTKLKFGAQIEKRYFYAHHSNPFLNLFAMAFRHTLEYTYSFPDYRVFKADV